MAGSRSNGSRFPSHRNPHLRHLPCCRRPAAMNGAQIQPRHPGMAPPGNPRDPLEMAWPTAIPEHWEALWAHRPGPRNRGARSLPRTQKYPFDSRPAREHADQMYPNQPVREEGRLVNPGRPAPDVRIVSSQERIYVAGSETVLFTLIRRRRHRIRCYRYRSRAPLR